MTVYFASDPVSGDIKIGFTRYRDPSPRAWNLRRLGRRASILAWIDGHRGTERRLHRRFALTRVDGEWFRPSGSLLALISAAKKAPGAALHDIAPHMADVGCHEDIIDLWPSRGEFFSSIRAPGRLTFDSLDGRADLPSATWARVVDACRRLGRADIELSLIERVSFDGRKRSMRERQSDDWNARWAEVLDRQEAFLVEIEGAAA